MKKASLSMVILSAAFLAACGNDNEGNNDGNNEAAQNNNNTENAANEEENNEAAEDSDPITIVTTLFPLEDFANKIGGDAVEVENLVPAGADAHTFEPSSQQMIQSAESDLFLYNGAGFEGFVDQMEETFEGQDVEMLEATAGIDLISYDHDHAHDEAHDHDDENNHGHDGENNHGHDDENNHDHDDENNHGHDNENNHGHDDENNHGHDDENNHGHDDENNHDHDHDHDHGDEDPHVWLDPQRAAEMAANIRDAFIELRPEHEEMFNENYEELAAELDELHERFSEELSDTEQDTIVVSHAGYGYWEEQYGIQQHGIAGLSPTNEPSISQIEDTIAMMEDNNINYVLFEQNIPENITEVVRDEVGAESLEIHNLEALTEEDIENDEDYFSLMESNLETLTEALQ